MRTMTLAEMQWIWTRRHLPLRKLVHAGERRRTRVGRNARSDMKVTVRRSGLAMFLGQEGRGERTRKGQREGDD